MLLLSAVTVVIRSARCDNSFKTTSVDMTLLSQVGESVDSHTCQHPTCWWVGPGAIVYTVKAAPDILASLLPCWLVLSFKPHSGYRQVAS